ncbi:MAG: hypothetical protein ABSF50_02080 [Burkholderiaceae bacterium]|jgi:hypothetical protein
MDLEMLDRYEDWLNHVFERPVLEDGWHLDVDRPDFDADGDEIVSLITHTLENCGTDLNGFSDEQVNFGLHYIFDSKCSQIASALKDDGVALLSRLRAIAAIRNLYEDCFSQRCAPVLGHIKEAGATPVNGICYMFWHSSDLVDWEQSTVKMRFYEAILEVLAQTLADSNPACVESALHGLGHLQRHFPSRVAEVIDTFRRKTSLGSPLLEHYAYQACRGRVR